MIRSSARLAAVVAAAVALSLGACGSKVSAPAEEATEVAVEPAAGTEAPAAAAPAAKPGEGAAPGPAAKAETAAAPAAPAPGPAANASATDELLQLAKSTPAAPGAAAEGPGAAAAAPGAESPSGDASANAGGYPPGRPPGESSGGGSGPGAMDTSAMARAYGPPPGQGNPNSGSMDTSAMAKMYAANQQGRSGPGGQSGPGGAPGGPGGPAGVPGATADENGPGGGSYSPVAPGANNTGEPSFENPVAGARAFLAAVQAKDPERLSEALALRSATESVPKHREMFQSILDKVASQETIDELATIFEGMQVTGTNTIKSTGMQGVTVGKMEKDGDMVTRTLEVRKEKLGWKVRDFGAARGNVKSSPRKGAQPAGGR